MKVWNGVAWLNGRQVHVYVAAKSRADVRRVMAESGFPEPSDSYVRDFFSPAWGKAMAGVKPERGVWVTKTHYPTGKPERLGNKKNGQGLTPSP